MKTLARTVVSTMAAGALAASAATPALADDRRDRDNDGISTGEVVAGALILGGIAAVAASADNDRDGRYNDRDGRYNDRDDRYNDRDGRYNDRDGRYYDRDGRYNDNDRRGYGYGYGMSPRQAVTQCVAVAERNANRYTRGRADVTDIRRVERIRGGYNIDGRIAVQSGRYRDGRRYGFGWGNDYRGWNDNLRGYDAGRFRCEVRLGRVVDVEYTGIRRL